LFFFSTNESKGQWLGKSNWEYPQGCDDTTVCEKSGSGTISRQLISTRSCTFTIGYTWCRRPTGLTVKITGIRGTRGCNLGWTEAELLTLVQRAWEEAIPQAQNDFVNTLSTSAQMQYYNLHRCGGGNPTVDASYLSARCYMAYIAQFEEPAFGDDIYPGYLICANTGCCKVTRKYCYDDNNNLVFLNESTELVQSSSATCPPRMTPQNFANKFYFTPIWFEYSDCKIKCD
jgi:hypothetical protein